MSNLSIFLSGVYLAIIGTGVIAKFVLGLFNPSTAYKFFHDFLLATLLYILLLGFWPIITGLGIIRRRNWARHSLFVMSFLAIFVGLSSSLSLIFLPQSFYSSQPKSFSYAFELFLSFVNFIFFIGIPIYFLIFFNKKPIKGLFVVKDKTHKKPHRPLGITLIAVLTFLSAMFFTIFSFDPKSLFIGNVFLSENLEKIYFLVIVIVTIYISIGFLRMQRTAWVAYIIFSIFSISIGVINILTIPKVTIFEIMPAIKNNYKDMPPILYKISGIMGIIIFIVPLLYVIAKRNLFFKNRNTESKPI